MWTLDAKPCTLRFKEKHWTDKKERQEQLLNPPKHAHVCVRVCGGRGGWHFNSMP